MVERVRVRPGEYHDSVTLMQVTAALDRLEGVDAALVATATALNLGLLADLGFDASAVGDVAPTDLFVAIRAGDDDAIAAAESRLDELLAASRSSGSPGGERFVPARSVGSAARARPEAEVALVSVPGPYAFAEAIDALEAGLDVVVFSDNVPVAQEVALKERAAELGRLALGPDCGTVVLDGVGLGFANVVRPGPVALVAASGTGAQQVCALLDHAGVGVRHVLGVGGRDLSAAVGGRSSRQALQRLDADPDVEAIALVAKAADPVVAEQVAELAASLSTPVVSISTTRTDDDLTAGTGRLLDIMGTPMPVAPVWGGDGGDAGHARPGALRALYSGGTLCAEALILAELDLDPGEVTTNLHGGVADLDVDGHLFVDFGDDALTAGRPHPMIDPLLRLERLQADAARPDTAVVLMDVVLGHGAQPDPAADLAPAIETARASGRASGGPAVIVALIGTRDDPQGLERQAGTLAAAGAHVYLSNAEAARHAVRLAMGAAR
jgi:FdrA protein